MGAETTAAAARRPAPIVLGYYPSWSAGMKPPAIRYELFTHLAHAFVGATTQGKVQTSGNLPSRDLVERTHAAGGRVLLSVGGADSGNYLGDLACNAQARARFVGELVALMNESGYDGIDLDWEFPRNVAERDALTTLARELRATAGRDRLLVSAQSGVAWACRYVDMKALRDSLDWVAVMTYDAHGPWGDHAGHNAPFVTPRGDRRECTSNSVTAQMDYWCTQGGWPRERLLVGIPCYGRGFPVPLYARLPKHKGKYARDYMPFREIERLISGGWKKHFDAEAQVPWLESPGGGEVVSYDDAASARRKAEWARSSGFGGVFFWEITQDRLSDGRQPVIEAAREGLLGRP
jgi:chitinase